MFLLIGQLIMNKILMSEYEVLELTPLSDVVGLQNASYVQLTMKNIDKTYTVKTPDVSSAQLSGMYQLQIDEDNIDLTQIKIGNFDGYIEIHY